ncbi:secreted protein [gut metagenome]|uniref:Secreted protein n=1 Tax=gut metagenome TaxID=749906 RepID=J9FN37_9ZZZZ
MITFSTEAASVISISSISTATAVCPLFSSSFTTSYPS